MGPEEQEFGLTYFCAEIAFILGIMKQVIFAALVYKKLNTNIEW